jgi:hypothetical protein
MWRNSLIGGLIGGAVSLLVELAMYLIWNVSLPAGIISGIGAGVGAGIGSAIGQGKTAKSQPVAVGADAAISFGDNVRVVSAPETEQLGIAGSVGQVFGETKPSVTGVKVVGETTEDYAIAVHFAQRSGEIWFASALLEFIDHAPGTEIVAGGRRLVRLDSGEWVESHHKSWWKFW